MKRLTVLPPLFALLLAGCADLEPPPPPSPLSLDDCRGCAAENDLQGEVLLFVNGKLSRREAGYTVNQVDPDGGAVIGSSFFLYDPARKGHLVKLGNVDFGPDPDNFAGFGTAAFRNVAWDRTHGLWALFIDSANDEWRLSHLLAPDFRGHDQRLKQQSFALRTTDPAYWEEELSGLGFVDGRLFLGARGRPNKDSEGGAVYLTELPTGHAPDVKYPDDLTFYADRDLTSLWGRFPANLGVAGDIAAAADGTMLCTVRSEHRSAAPLDANLLFSTPLDPPAFTDTGVQLQVVRNDDFSGLGVVKGKLYAIDTGARIFELDPESGKATLHDDLSTLFTDPLAGIRIRGAAVVEVPAP